jgi:hypothetical protein
MYYPCKIHKVIELHMLSFISLFSIWFICIKSPETQSSSESKVTAAEEVTVAAARW